MAPNRLSKIYAFVKNYPSDIALWDLCCDHGKLGIMSLNADPERHVHFNDISGPIIEKLSRKLSQNFHTNYTLYAKDAKELEIDSSVKSIVTIAGVGGECALGIICELNKVQKLDNSVLIICSHYYQFELRVMLAQMHFKLLSEEFFFDGRWPYELLVVSKSEGGQIPAFSKSLYDLSDISHLKYLRKLKKHYQLKKNLEALVNLDFL